MFVKNCQKFNQKCFRANFDPAAQPGDIMLATQGYEKQSQALKVDKFEHICSIYHYLMLHAEI